MRRLLKSSFWATFFLWSCSIKTVAVTASSVTETPIEGTDDADQKQDKFVNANDEIIVSVASEEDEEVLDLDAMSNEELQAVCTDRGFELVKEKKQDGTSMEYKHKDYVEAARQCLQIEKEMEKAIEENPEILEELKAEAERMKAEKARLEAELAKAKESIAEGDQQHSGSSSSGGSSTAFISKSGEKKVEENEQSDDVNGAEEKSNDASTPVVDDDTQETEKPSEEKDDENKEGDDASNPPAPAETSDMMKPDEPTNNVDTTTAEDLRFLTVVQESVLKMKDDLERVLTPIVIALKPYALAAKEAGISTFYMAKRYIVALIDARREAQQAQQAEPELDSGGATTTMPSAA